MAKKRAALVVILILSVYFALRQANAAELLSWHDCVKEAAVNHPDLISAEQAVVESQASKNVTASALYPQVTASLQASTSKTSSPTAGSSTTDSYSYGLDATQLIFDGTKTFNDVKAAAENVKASRENFKYTSATVRFRLRNAFVNLLKAQEMLRITQEIYNIRRENFELITLRYESGLEHKGALMTSEADLADAKYGISQARRNMEVTQRDLVKEMGRRRLSSVEVKGDFEVVDSVKEKPDFEALAKSNPSLLNLAAQSNAAEFNLRSAYANFSPSLTGSAAADRNGTHLPARGSQWNLGLTLSMPVFEGGLRIAQVEKAKAALNQLQEDQRSTRDGIVLTLEETWASFQDTLDNVAVQKKSLLASEERSRIAQAQYSTGFVTFDNWIIIEDNLVKAKKAYLDAQANVLLAEAKWIQAKGETLEYE